MTTLRLSKMAIIFFFSFSLAAQAAEVVQVKENKVLIKIDTEDIQPDQEYYLLNAADKKTGLIQISQVKNGKAIGNLTKGKAEVGMRLLAKAGATQKTGHNSDNATLSVSTKLKNSWGLLLGYSMQTMSASFRGGVPVKDYSLAMSGSSLSYFGFFNYVYSPNIVVELSGGIYPLAVATTITDTACIGQTTNCNVNITYFDGAMLAKYYLPFKMKHKFWLGGGMDFLMPSSKSTTVLSEADIGINQMFRFGLGADLFVIGKKSFIPIQLDYSMFPPSAGVSSSAMNVRFGYGISF